MDVNGKSFLMLALLALLPFSCGAQCTTGTSACNQGVPHFVKFNGTVRNGTDVPGPGVFAIRFVIYGVSTGGTPLWQEVQNARIDEQGHYEVMLGTASSEGIPSELFNSGEPRWLGAQLLLPGREEQPRVLMVSVPYALEAANAQTLGGLPPSAFAKVAPLTPLVDSMASGATLSGNSTIRNSSEAAVANPSVVPTLAGAAVTTTGGTVDTIAKFSSPTSVVTSQITDSNGVVSVENLSNVLFAERFPGGVPDAVNACPAAGCVIYAVSPRVNLNLGTIDPGGKVITIYLGPYSYTVKQITLRKGFRLIGMGASDNGTVLMSTNGNNPVFVIPQTNNTPATNVKLLGFRLFGSVGNTQEDGFFLDTSSTVNSGLWYSTIDDVYLQGFAGIGIHIKGRNNDFAALTQWVLFNNVIVFRTAGGGNALRMEGAAFELRFRNCEFDGQAVGDGTNVYLGGLPGGVSGYPLTIVFEGLVSQAANLAVQIDGGVNISFHGSHHEKLVGAYQITSNISPVGTKGLTISDSYFAGDVATNGGTGYELSITTSFAKGIFFVHNRFFGNPDSIVQAINISSVVYQDNLYLGASNVPPTSGITAQLVPASSINIQGVHSVGLNPSTTPITTIQSSLGPGEMVTFFTFAGPVIFGSGGNLNLMGLSTLTVNGSITFIRNDLTGAPQWLPVSQWNLHSSLLTPRPIPTGPAR